MNHLVNLIQMLIYVNKKIIFFKNNLFILDGYEFDSWKKFFEYTKQQESMIIIPFKQHENSMLFSL